MTYSRRQAEADSARAARARRPDEFQLNEDYDNNFCVFVGLLHRLRAKYEYVKRGYEQKNLPPGRSLKHLVSIIESFIDLASNSIAAPPNYEGRVRQDEVPVPEGARSDHVMRRRMAVIEDSGRLYALDPAVVISGELCMCGGGRRRSGDANNKAALQQEQQRQQQQQQQLTSDCEHCLFEKRNLLRIARDLSRLADKHAQQQQQQQRQQQQEEDESLDNSMGG